MSIDLVHDTQEAYRILLNCMAHPGHTGTLAGIQDHLQVSSPISKGLLLLALTLLDGETSFAVPRDNDSTNASAAILALMESHLARICSCPITRPEQAGFLFVPYLDESGFNDEPALFGHRAREAIETACKGTFLAPHLGATIVLELERLVEASTKSPSWILEGPGIDGTSRFSCSPKDSVALGMIVEARNNSCKEFPLGVDLVITDQEFRLICIPRSSSVKEA